MVFDSYIKNDSFIVFFIYFFMILVKCKNFSDKFFCGEDFDVMLFILFYVDIILNCLVSVLFFRKIDLVFVDICFIYFFFFMERIIFYFIKNIVCIFYLDRGGIFYG